MNNGYLDAIFFLVSCAIAVYVFAYLVQSINILLISALEVLIGSLFIFLYLIVWESKPIASIFTQVPKETFQWLCFAGVFSFLGANYFSLQNLKAGNVGTNGLLAPFITISSSVLAVLFLDDVINSKMFVGILITSASVLYYLSKPNTKNSFNKRSLLSGLASVIFISGSIICSIKGATKSNLSLFHIVFIKLLITVPFSLLIVSAKLNKLRNIRNLKVSIFILLVGVLLQTIFANYFWFGASLKLGTVTFQIIIALLPFVIGVIDAFVIRKKQLDKRFYSTAFFAVIGIACFFYFKFNP